MTRITNLTKVQVPVSESEPAAEKSGGNKLKIFDFLIFASIGFVFFLCPIFFTGITAQGLGFDKMMLFYFLVLLGMVFWAVKGVVGGELKLKRTPLDFPILITIAIFAVSAIFSVSRRDSLIGFYGSPAQSLISVVAFTLFYYLVVNNVNLRRIKIIFWLSASSAALVIFHSVCQFFGLHLLPLAFARDGAFNPVGSPVSLAVYLVMAMPLLIAAASHTGDIHPSLGKTRTSVIKAVSVIFLLALLGVLFALSGFVYWPAAVATVVIMLMFMMSKIVKTTSGALTVPLIAFLLLITFLILGNLNLVKVNLPSEVSLSRSASFDIAREGIKNHPFLGTGPGTFYYTFGRYKGGDFNASPLWNVRFNSAGGALFETVNTVGILGALAALVIVLILVSISFISLTKTAKKETHPILLAAFSSFAAALIFASLFSLGSSIIILMIIAGIFAAAVAVNVYPEDFKAVSLSFKASPKYALALAAVFLSVTAGVVVLFTIGVKMYLADYYAGRAVSISGYADQTVYYEKAVSLAPYRDAYFIDLANSYMNLANEEAGKQSPDQAKIENYLSSAIGAGKKAQELNPNSAATIEALALIYENASYYTGGALEWAEKLYESIKELEPDNPVPYLRLGLIDVARAGQQKDDNEEKNFYYAEAIKNYDEAIKKKNDFTPAYYGKAVVYEQTGKTDEAIDSMKNAVASDSSNADYYLELGRLYYNRGISQSGLSQTDTKTIAEENAGGEGQDKELSVQSNQSGGVAKRNNDITAAEQSFLFALQINPNHLNALYGIAILYQKIGETDNAKIAVRRMLDIAQNQDDINTIKKQFVGLY